MMDPGDVLTGFGLLIDLVDEIDTLGRADLDTVVAMSSRVRSWHDSFDVRCARRARELQGEGKSAGAEAMFNRAGKKSSKEGSAISIASTAGPTRPEPGRHRLARARVAAMGRSTTDGRTIGR